MQISASRVQPQKHTDRFLRCETTGYSENMKAFATTKSTKKTNTLHHEDNEGE